MKLHIITGIAALAALVVSCGNPKSDGTSQETQAAQEVQKKDFPKVYDDNADPVVQIDQAIAAAQAEGKFVIAQVGGNWCPLVPEDLQITSAQMQKSSRCVDDNFIYTHINVRKKNVETGKNETCTEAMAKLGNPMRFGYPVMVVLDGNGKVLHTQDSSYLESGESYDKDKVIRFFKNWKPSAIAQ